MAELTAKAKKIKLVATDIDGVWTDARMYVTPEGEWMKAFSTYDGMATAMLQKKGDYCCNTYWGKFGYCYCTG